MKNRLAFSIGALFLTLTFTAPTGAAPILTGSGIESLSLNGRIFDVEFGDRDGATYGEVAALNSKLGADFNALFSSVVSLIRNSVAGTTSRPPFDGCQSQRGCNIQFPTLMPPLPFTTSTPVPVVEVLSDANGFQVFDRTVDEFSPSANTTGQSAATFGVIAERAVPAPATLALFGLGLAGLGLNRGKHKAH